MRRLSIFIVARGVDVPWRCTSPTPPQHREQPGDTFMIRYPFKNIHRLVFLYFLSMLVLLVGYVNSATETVRCFNVSLI